MAASYPTSAKTFTPKADGPGNTILADYINALQDEIAALEAALLTGGLEHNLFPESTGDARTLGTSSKYWGVSFVKALSLLDASELTVASGAVVVTQGYHRVDTEGDAATDDLATLTATGLSAGFIVILRAENVSRVVTLKDGTGNLLLQGDYALNATDRTIMLIFDGTNWRELARASAAVEGITSGSSKVTQIAFNATQSASADANTLDDYEEGTFTPTLDFGSGTTGLTYTVQSGHYVKIGKNVWIVAQITINSNGSSSGTAHLNGLPFAEGDSISRPFTLDLDNASGLTGAGGARLDAGTSRLTLHQWGSGGLGAIDESELVDGAIIRVSGWYRAAN